MQHTRCTHSSLRWRKLFRHKPRVLNQIHFHAGFNNSTHTLKSGKTHNITVSSKRVDAKGMGVTLCIFFCISDKCINSSNAQNMAHLNLTTNSIYVHLSRYKSISNMISFTRSTSIECYKEVHGPHIPTTHPGFVDQAGLISPALSQWHAWQQFISQLHTTQRNVTLQNTFDRRKTVEIRTCRRPFDRHLRQCAPLIRGGVVAFHGRQLGVAVGPAAGVQSVPQLCHREPSSGRLHRLQRWPRVRPEIKRFDRVQTVAPVVTTWDAYNQHQTRSILECFIATIWSLLASYASLKPPELY